MRCFLRLVKGGAKENGGAYCWTVAASWHRRSRHVCVCRRRTSSSPASASVAASAAIARSISDWRTRMTCEAREGGESSDGRRRGAGETRVAKPEDDARYVGENWPGQRLRRRPLVPDNTSPLLGRSARTQRALSSSPSPSYALRARGNHPSTHTTRARARRSSDRSLDPRAREIRPPSTSNALAAPPAPHAAHAARRPTDRPPAHLAVLTRRLGRRRRRLARAIVDGHAAAGGR